MKGEHTVMKNISSNQDLFSLKGKNVVLTGAAGYFGQYFAKALLNAGARSLHIIDRNEDAVNALEAELEDEFETQQDIWPNVVDLYDHKEVDRIFSYVNENFGPIDVLVNNAFDFSSATGFNSPHGRIETMRYEEFEKAMDSGVYWYFQATQHFGNAAKLKKSQLSVVNITSMYAHVAPNPLLYGEMEYINPPGYSMAKAALLAQSRYAAAWLGPTVRVNTISPGAIPNTEKESNNSKQNENVDFMNRLIERTLLKRVGHPLDLIGPLVFLASDASSYMTGQTIIVDGGWTIT